MKKPIFLIFVGVPGSGKTTLSKIIASKYSFSRVSTDEIKVELEDQCKKYDISELFEIQRQKFIELMNSKVNIISDSNSDKVCFRQKLVELAEEFNYDYSIIYLKNNYHELVKRVRLRKNSLDKSKRFVSEEILKKYIYDLEVPSNACVVDTSSDVQECVRKIILYLEEKYGKFK